MWVRVDLYDMRVRSEFDRMETAVPKYLRSENRPKNTPVVDKVVRVDGGEVNNQTV